MANEVASASDEDSTRKIVLDLRHSVDAIGKAESARAGAASVWRGLGGLAATVAIALGTAALVYAQQAAVDHEVVMRHERQLDGNAEQLTEIRAELATQTALMQRVEHQLDQDREHQ